MHNVDMFFPAGLAANIVHCVEDAVGDDIREDIQRNELRTKNSVPTRIWDLLNTNLVKMLETEDCTVAKAKRGPWEMLIIFEKTSQCIFTFMREKRFTELRKRQRKRERMHYLDMVVRQFNKELLSRQQQITFLPHKFSDEDRLAELVQILLSDMKGDASMVRHHVLILFDTVGYQLTRIRAVKITPNLDIAQNCEQDWSQYISAAESSVVEKVDRPDEPVNQPNRGLSFKASAIARKKDKPQQRDVKQENEKRG